MRTFVIEGKPLEEVTIKVKGQSLTLTEGVEVTVIVVVASQQKHALDAAGFCAHGYQPPVVHLCPDCKLPADPRRK